PLFRGRCRTIQPILEHKRSAEWVVSAELGGNSSSRALFRRLPVWQFPIGPDEVAGVSRRIALQVILVFRFGFPKGSDRRKFSDDLAGPQARSVDIGNGVFRDPLLLFAGVEDGR